jgi:hypothetical protein
MCHRRKRDEISGKDGKKGRSMYIGRSRPGGMPVWPGLSSVPGRQHVEVFGSVGAQMTGPLGNAGLSCAKRGGAQQAALRPSRALSRKQAKKSEEAVRDWVTLGKCDKGKQQIAASLRLPLAVACSRVWKA